VSATCADVVVVGAGPAGSTAALLLARAGHDVLILDRHEFPRAKPCGDCLSAAASGLLHRLGLFDRIRTLPHARLAGWRIVAPGGAEFTALFGCDGPAATRPTADYALAVERAAFDAALLDAAVAAGARFLPAVRVTDVLRGGRNGAGGAAISGVRAAGDAFRARFLIGADGLRSVVARRLGALGRPPRLRKLSLTLHVAELLRDDAAATLGEMHCGDGICAGIAPLRGDGSRCNLTIVADADRFGREVAVDPHAFIRRALSALPHLDNHAARSFHGLPILASGPFDWPVRRTVFDGAALVGDAAGYYDPFTGQGVYQAMAGAELLATAASTALRHDDCSARRLAPYARALRRLLRGPRLVQHGIEAVLSRPRLADCAIRRIHHAPRFASTIIGVTGDTLPPARLFSPLALVGLLGRA
jgi:menaquinone-9 beta-reductase